MAHGLLREAGYHLAPNLGPPTLQQSLCATWPREVLAMRNGHVARELVQRAISARNGNRAALLLLLFYTWHAT